LCFRAMSKNRYMDKVPEPLLVAIDMSEITFTKQRDTLASLMMMVRGVRRNLDPQLAIQLRPCAQIEQFWKSSIATCLSEVWAPHQEINIVDSSGKENRRLPRRVSTTHYGDRRCRRLWPRRG
jgi:hypothetical protein